jgi:hypothetical protein
MLKKNAAIIIEQYYLKNRHRMFINNIDPITQDQISGKPFLHKCGYKISRFQADTLADYITNTGQFKNPLTQLIITKKHAKQLDHVLYINNMKPRHIYKNYEKLVKKRNDILRNQETISTLEYILDKLTDVCNQMYISPAVVYPIDPRCSKFIKYITMALTIDYKFAMEYINFCIGMSNSIAIARNDYYDVCQFFEHIKKDIFTQSDESADELNGLNISLQNIFNDRYELSPIDIIHIAFAFNIIY